MRKGLATAARFLLPILLNGPPHLLRTARLLVRLRFGKRSLEERLADFPVSDLPLERPARIYMDDHQIPFVEAETDRDAAACLGLVHAHLRLGQMELMRRLARGRMAELFGPPALKLDISLRSLGLETAVPAMEAALPPETRAWMEGFVAGINACQDRMRRLPMEFELLRIPRTPWAIADVLAVSRLAGADVNWLIWLDLLRLRGVRAWRVIWAKALDLGLASPPSYTPEDWEAYLPRLLGHTLRAGSNAFAVRGKDKAFLAGDPHLGTVIPNLWLIAGCKSPSYHMAGFMVPGLPFMALGRNLSVAWGGTNMYAASSDLVDIGDLPPDRIGRRIETFRIRGWPAREVAMRVSPYGPVISDAPFLKRYHGPPLALRWTGHHPSDEISAFLAANRARNWEEFRRAFAPYAVSGQNMVYADAEGKVGQILAVRLPLREGGPPKDLLVQPRESDRDWARLIGSCELPSWLNPPEGRVVSANNRPLPLGFPVGYLFPPGDRHKRIHALLEEMGEPTVAGLKAIQGDVHSPASKRLAVLLSRRLEEAGAAGGHSGTARMLKSLADWDGGYGALSRGAAAFQLVMHAFALPYLRSCYGKELTAYLLSSEAFSRVLEEELAREPSPAMRASLRLGARRAYARWRRRPAWGLMHRLRPAHPFRMLPLLGRLFAFGDMAAGGSSQTVMKTAHPVTGGPHAVTYGAIARHVSDLSDPDGNHFALLGGQDGWLRSRNTLDLWEAWKKGFYVRVPLRMESVRADFRHVLELSPARPQGGSEAR